MKYLRADFRFALPDDFDDTALQALELSVWHLRSPIISERRHTACMPTRDAELKGVNGHSPFVHNQKLGYNFTGYVGAYELRDKRWVELPSGIVAHGSTLDGWLK